METLVQDYLRTHSLANLAKAHGVYARLAGYKFSLNYDQIEAVDSDPLSQECRGLILRTKDGRTLSSDDEIVGETVILARPMKRFFNFGQGAAAQVDFASPDTGIFEKFDGTLCILYFDDLADEWCVATRSVPNADLPIDGFGDRTFSSLFKDTVAAQSGVSWDRWVLSLEASKGYTFCFELMTAYNQVVVYHKDAKVALITMREISSGGEVSFKHCSNMAAMLHVGSLVRHSIPDLQALLDFVNSRSGTEFEGVVACDANHNRVKVKSAAYLVASRAKSLIGASPRNLLELILLGQLDDVMSVLTDDHKAAAEKMQEDLRKLFIAFETKYGEVLAEVVALGQLSDRVARKSFAQGCMAHGLWMSPAMQIWEGKFSCLKDWVMARKGHTKDGTFPSGFLDTLLFEMKQVGG